jgi:hypothetical protein
MTEQRRNGFALIAAIAALAFVEIVAIGLIALTSRARISAEEYATRSAANLVAESAIRLAIAHWDELALGFPTPGSPFAVPWAAGVTPGGTSYAVHAERLRRGQLLLRANAWFAPGIGARASAVATVTSIPSDEARLDFHSAVTAGGDLTLLAGTTVDGTSPGAAAAPLQPTDCVDPGPSPAVPAGTQRPGVALTTGASLTQSVGASVMGAPAILNAAARTSPSSFQRFGRVPFADLAAIADAVVTGTVTIGPRTAGVACDTLAWGNWGSPGNRTHPCFDWLPLVYSPGDLTIAGGEGQGILVVDGDLTIAAGSRFAGAVLVTGRIDAGAATIDGALRIGGAGSRSAASIRFDECALTRAFTRSPAMRKVYRVADRWWLPPW